jgi:hypothetical protein
MPELMHSSILHNLLLLTLLLFCLGSSMMTLVTLTNAVRLRNVLISWRSGQVFGLPAFPSFFLTTSLLLFGLAWAQGFSEYFLICGAYVFIALNWFVSSYFMSKRYITDHGVVKNINDPSQTVSWARIQDFIEFEPQKAPGGISRLITGRLPQFRFQRNGKHKSQDVSQNGNGQADTSKKRDDYIKSVIQARQNPEHEDKIYTFIYTQKTSSDRLHESEHSPDIKPAFQCQRLQLEVPGVKVGPFRKILNHKLGRRFQHTFSDEPLAKRFQFPER